MTEQNVFAVFAHKIYIPENALRQKIDTSKSEKAEQNWNNFKDSISKVGILHPVIVVPFSGEGDEYTHTLVDGVQRVSACLELDVNFEVPCILDNGENVMEKSIISNAHRFATKPADLARQIKRWNTEEGKTLSDICAMLSFNESQVLKYLSLNVFEGHKAIDHINDGSITLGNAILLKTVWNRIDDYQRSELVEKALEQTAVDFGKTIELVKDEFKKAKLTLTDLENEEFSCKPKYSRDRLNEVWARVQQGYEDSVALGEQLSSEDSAVYSALAYIHTYSVADIEEQRKAWKAKQDERIAKEKERQDKADSKS